MPTTLENLATAFAGESQAGYILLDQEILCIDAALGTIDQCEARTERVQPGWQRIETGFAFVTFGPGRDIFPQCGIGGVGECVALRSVDIGRQRPATGGEQQRHKRRNPIHLLN